jgi:hypothetical protein
MKKTRSHKSRVTVPIEMLLPEVHANGDVSVLYVHLGDAKDVPVHGHCNHPIFFKIKSRF